MKCGQKVLAEKARYNRPKSADHVVESPHSDLSDPVAATDDDGMGLSTGSSESDYTPPTVFVTPTKKSKKRTLLKSEEGGRLKIAKVETGEGMCLLLFVLISAFNLSSPSYEVDSSPGCQTSYFDLHPELDDQPSYVTTPVSSGPCDVEVLPLYTDYCDEQDEMNDDDRLDFLESLNKYTLDESCSSFRTILCIKQYA